MAKDDLGGKIKEQPNAESPASLGDSKSSASKKQQQQQQQKQQQQQQQQQQQAAPPPPQEDPQPQSSKKPPASEADTSSKHEEEALAWKKDYMYLSAEFENYKKQVFKERAHAREYAHQHLAYDILGCLDSLEKSRSLSQDENFQKGMDLILKQFLTTLEKFNVTRIKTEGASFDPELHEALSSLPSDRPGLIVEELRAGYKIHDLVLRPSQVIVGK